MADKVDSKLVNVDSGVKLEGKGTMNDDELDSLLDDALQDFVKSDVENSQMPEELKKEPDIKLKRAKADSRKPGRPFFCDQEFGDLFSEEDFDKMTEELSKAFKDLPTGDFNLISNFTENACNSTSSKGKSVEPSLEANLENAWKSMAQNLSDAKKESPDGLFEKDFLNTFKGMDMATGDGNPENFISVIQSMMTNLLSKDVLYPSLKEINTKYPSWLDENRSKLDENDFRRFTRQQVLVTRICTEFENESERDSEEIKMSRLDKIMELMQRMQECGQPPMDLLGQMENDSSASFGNWPPKMENADQCVCM